MIERGYKGGRKIINLMIIFVLFPVCVSIKSDGCESEELSSSIMAHCLKQNIIFISYFPSIHYKISVEYMISDTRLLVEKERNP